MTSVRLAAFIDRRICSGSTRAIIPPRFHQLHARTGIIRRAKVCGAAIGGLYSVRRLVRQCRFDDRIGEAFVRRPVGEAGAETVDVERLLHVAHDLEQRHVGHRLSRHAGEYHFGSLKPHCVRLHKHRQGRF